MHTDPNGNILVYTINTATANGWLSMWNSTDAVNYPANNNYTTTPGEAFYWMWRPPVDQNINAAKYGYDWNVTLPAAVQGGTPYWVGDNVMLGTTSLTSNGAYGTNSYSVWALSLAPATRGQLLWEAILSATASSERNCNHGSSQPDKWSLYSEVERTSGVVRLFPSHR